MGFKTLELTLISAKDLKNVNLIGKMDVYVVVHLSDQPKSKQKTPVHQDGGTHPCWNYTMRFTVDEADSAKPGKFVVFQLKHEHTFGADKELGEVMVPLRELFDSVGKDPTAPQFVTYQVKTSSGKAKGEFKFSFKFVDVDHNAAGGSNPYPPAASGYPAPSAGAYPPPGQAPYPPSGHAPPAGYPMPPQAGYPQGGPPPGVPYAAPQGYPPQQQPGYGYPPQQQPGYGYPPQGGPGGYGYPPQGGPGGYGYPPPGSGGYPQQYPPAGYGSSSQKPQKPKKNKNGGFGMGLGAGLLGGAIGGLVLGEVVEDSFDGGFDDGGFDF